MKLDLNKFYNTNYKDFVHKEAVEEALRMVAEIDLKDVEIDTILSITFSVDEFGENPIYVEYLDKDGKKHIVRIRPAVTNEIQEILKRYVTLEQHETDKQDIYNHFETLNVPLELRSQNGLDDEGNKNITLNNDNSFISFQVDPENDDAIQWLCIHNKNGSLGSQYQYMARFVDYAKVDQVPSNAEFLEKIQQLEELIQRKSQETLQSSKEYADAQDDTLRTEIITNVTNQINETKNDILSYADVEVDELREYVDSRDAEYHELAKQYADNVKQEAVNSSKTYTDTKTAEMLETSKTYTDTKHTEVTQRVTELENDILSYVDVEVDELREYVDSRDAEYHELAKQYADNVKQEAVNSSKTYTDTKTAETLETSKTYTDTKHTEVTQHVTELENDMNTNFATKQELLINVASLSDIDQQNFETLNDRINAKATVYKKNIGDSVRYYFPQINVTTKTDGDIILEGKDETTVKLANLLNDEQLAKLKNLPMGQETDLNKVNKKTNSYIWDVNNQQTIDFGDGNEVYYDVRDDKITKIGIKEKAGASQKIVQFDEFVKQKQLDSLNGIVQELATNVNGSQIGERTKINFTLTNSSNEEATNPTITKNESYYVKVGSQYIVSVYLTFNVDVTPTSAHKALAFSWIHDIPAENPPLTLTVVTKSNKRKYTTTTGITTGRHRVVFYIPAFPATDIYESTEITIYGSAITKDLTKESEE